MELIFLFNQNHLYCSLVFSNRLVVPSQKQNQPRLIFVGPTDMRLVFVCANQAIYKLYKGHLVFHYVDESICDDLDEAA